MLRKPGLSYSLWAQYFKSILLLFCSPSGHNIYRFFCFSVTFIRIPSFCNGSGMIPVCLPLVSQTSNPMMKWPLAGQYLAPILKKTDTNSSTLQYFQVYFWLGSSRACLDLVRQSLASSAVCAGSPSGEAKLCKLAVVRQESRYFEKFESDTAFRRINAFRSSIREHYLQSCMSHFSTKSCF